MKITIPELSLVVLVGPSGAGKSTFARKHFKATETLSSDFCRGLVSDDENNQAATKDAFEVLHFIAAKRLAAGRLTVVDYNWAAEYRGRAMVVYGHTPVPEPEWLNGTINIETGCVFGGRLTALRYPEKELVSVPAERVWCQPAKPFLAPEA